MTLGGVPIAHVEERPGRSRRWSDYRQRQHRLEQTICRAALLLDEYLEVHDDAQLVKSALHELERVLR